MTDTTRDLLVRGIAAAKSGDQKEARFYLEWLLRLEPGMEERKEAWYWMSKISTDKAEKRKYLEEILVNDLWDSRARRDLAVLDGKLKESDIIDPNRLVANAASEQAGAADRFTCPQCGGRMTFTPSGQNLTCEYCASNLRLTLTKEVPVEADGADFIIGLATARGHLKPATVHTITCKGCGASLILPAQQLTQNCPYCQSSYVLAQTATTETITPDALIPFRVNEAQAKLALRGWFAQQKFEERPRVARGQGIYFPVWLFNMGGQITLRYELQTDRDTWVGIQDARVVQQQDILVPAIQRFSEALQAVFQSYDLSALTPYEEFYLADWLAETYQVSMSDASLDARQKAFSEEKERTILTIEGRFRDVRFSSAGMLVESYQFILLPVWVTTYQIAGKSYSILINGANGKVYAESPREEGWLARLFGG
jgi:uncharacterized CHY-type Zn-finger protein